MSEVRNYARECGIRCRQIRMAKGMSQQQLAEKMNVTSAAISKWEKEGINNIDQIMRLSDVLGQDITADQLDQEGTVGEVGKEILRRLAFSEGSISADDLFDDMYGMKQDRISNELFKLERIGIIVREQFRDFSNEERDYIFITAKGLIAYKNFEPEGPADLDSVMTWDRLMINDATSIQEVIDKDVTTQLILNGFDYLNSFRFDYLTYLHFSKANLIVPHTEMGRQNQQFWWEVGEALLCGTDCYIDVLTRMAQAANRKEFDDILAKTPTITGVDYNDKIYEMEHEIAGVDDIAEEAMKYFADRHKHLNIELTQEEKGVLLKENRKKRDELWDLQLNSIDELYPLRAKETEFFKALSIEKKGNINKWFSYDEIYNFIDKNILPPVTEYEKYVDEQLHKIWEYDKSTLRYYYQFTDFWEENGLAQFIRDRVGVPKWER